MSEQDQSPLARIFEDAVSARPVIDPDYVGMPGLPVPPEEGHGFIMNWDHVKDGIPDHYVPNMAYTSMTHYYPWFKETILTDYVVKVEEDTFKAIAKLNQAFRNFLAIVLSDVEGTGCVMTYDGMIEFTEVVYIRYNLDRQKSITYVVEQDKLPLFVEAWSRADQSEENKQLAINWTRLPVNNASMSKRNYRRNVTQLGMEIPHSYLLLGDDNVFDGLVNGDFQIIESQIETFNKRLRQLLKGATTQSADLVRSVYKKDHSLILGFRATDTFDNLRISLDRIPAKLPNGEINIGENEILLSDWEGYNPQTISTIRKIKKYEVRANKLIRDTLVHIKDHPYIRQQFADNLRTQLIASSHFIKEVYAIGVDAAQPLVNELAEEIVNKLNARGGNIGLDLNNWIVYQYHEDNSRPTPILDDELNFKEHIFEKYLDRFMDYLGAFLQNVKSPYIRPYTYRVLVEEDDGVAIGSVRRG